MSLPITSVGRVCLCEWSGPVTISMLVALLSQVKHTNKREAAPLLLILALRETSGRYIMHQSSSFADLMPALWAYCEEIAIACRVERCLIHQLRLVLGGQAATPMAMLSRPLKFFELLDDAVQYAQMRFPHDMLELQRQRLNSGTWLTLDSLTKQCRSK